MKTIYHSEYNGTAMFLKRAQGNYQMIVTTTTIVVGMKTSSVDSCI